MTKKQSKPQGDMVNDFTLSPDDRASQWAEGDMPELPDDESAVIDGDSIDAETPVTTEMLTDDEQAVIDESYKAHLARQHELSGQFIDDVADGIVYAPGGEVRVVELEDGTFVAESGEVLEVVDVLTTESGKTLVYAADPAEGEFVAGESVTTVEAEFPEQPDRASWQYPPSALQHGWKQWKSNKYEKLPTLPEEGE